MNLLKSNGYTCQNKPTNNNARGHIYGNHPTHHRTKTTARRARREIPYRLFRYHNLQVCQRRHIPTAEENRAFDPLEAGGRTGIHQRIIGGNNEPIT